MDLITGGLGQGKRAYVQKEYKIDEGQMISGEVFPVEELKSAEEKASYACIYDFHLLIRRLVRAGIEPQMWVEKFLEKAAPQVIITNEVGCGIVPVDAMEREWREAAGRAACLLAEHAKHVVRVTCGMAQRIK
jgi:adenosyl cobinamide kinase/adenosyl cobinamide phosphate guanylyltransferase